MRDWQNIGKAAIFSDKTKNGLLFQFLKEYKQQFGGSISPGCRKCLEKYYNNYLNSFKMSTEQSHGYKLKLKYNGISLNSRSRPLRNGEMTEKQAIELLEKHPHGAKLFDSIPKAPVKIEVKPEPIKQEVKQSYKQNKKSRKK